MKLNLGCGHNVAPGWVNVDYSLGSRLRWLPFSEKFFRQKWDKSILVIDLRRTFPWPDNSVDAIYCSHFLEHLTKSNGEQFLSECARVLKPGTPVRFVVPDLSVLIEQYNAGELPAYDFVDRLEVNYGGTGSAWKDRLAYWVQFPHKCMYDGEALVSVLSAAGFKAEIKNGFESKIPEIEGIEQTQSLHNAVIVEAISK